MVIFVILICIFLMIKDLEHLFLYLFAIHIPSSVKSVFKCFAQFFLLSYLFSYGWVFSIFMYPRFMSFAMEWFGKNFFVVCYIIAHQCLSQGKHLILLKFSSLFFFVNYAFHVYPRNVCATLAYKDYLLRFIPEALQF